MKLDTNLIVFLGIFYVTYVKIAPTDTIPLWKTWAKLNTFDPGLVYVIYVKIAPTDTIPLRQLLSARN